MKGNYNDICYQDLIPGLQLNDGTISMGKRLGRTFRLRNALMAKAFHLEGKRVLDIGCSICLHSLYLAENAEQVIGVDHDEKAISTAINTSKAMGFNNVQFLLGDIRDKRFFDSLGYFDLVVAWGLLHRISDPFSFLDLTAKVGDALFLEFRTPVLPYMSKISLAYHSTEDNIDLTNIGEFNNNKKVESNTGFWDITPGGVAIMAKRVGFEVEEILGYGDSFISEKRLFIWAWYNHLKKILKKGKPQIPLTRVHLLLQKRKGSIQYSPPLSKAC